ncbi:acyl-CoA ligase (AMP-forming), exosortase A system-associated [Altererythrobacter indicus]|uniref:Acyl-CoA ligase (AMP-forming), exosortase A system-associated n=1 Tax=Altericroceibacterium indicum TaxID=374177 RepID=A0A845A4W9_9SPHN|nr:acyl-CoA ligase (AMP-forming), exosortase A system-associated [Altericroceibacterium indicum]MXP25342.1 acyl-CoA ligase (AMP-forming), exosortase A system-associated [Altericroceibacterium indicum]
MPILPNPQPLPLDHCVLYGHDSDTALILRGHLLTYKELRQKVAQLAAWLSVNVPQKGARVASWGAKDLMTCLLPLAAPRAGLVHVPINPLLKHGQVAHILADSGAQLLLGTGARLSTLVEGDLPQDCIALDIASIPALLDGEGLPPSDADTNDLAAILYTSGSTGKPKGVMLSHANMWLGAVSVAHYLELESDDVVLAVLPLSFDYGQNQLLSAWRAGAAVVPLDYLLPRDVVKACARHQVTTLAAVPPLWVQLLEQDWPEDATRSMRRLTNSGGALTLDLVRGLQDKLPETQIFPMYGLTEAFRSTYLRPELVAEHPVSMGQAVPFAEILVMNDTGQLVSAGEEGELVHCGPLVAQGYWQDDERTAERFRPAPEQSSYGGIAVWSGDRVVRDGEGLLYFVGRRDAMIKSAGNRISPQEVEEAALASGLVAEAVALGVADARLGQAVHLVVRAHGDDLAKAEEQLPAILSRELPNFMRPQMIHWRDIMPLNPNGKIDRVALAKDIQP